MVVEPGSRFAVAETRSREINPAETRIKKNSHKHSQGSVKGYLKSIKWYIKKGHWLLV